MTQRQSEAGISAAEDAGSASRPEAVTVDNEYSGQTATLDHTELIEIIEAYRHELGTADAER